MGQKVHPTGIRLGISTEWTSRWYAEGRGYAEFLQSDLEIREYLKKKLKQASVSRIQIDRPAKAAFITIHTARPGIVIGKKGEDIEALRKEVARRTGLSVNNVKINVGGRLNGAEIARSEWYREGRVPLHTLRANIDYGFAEALTTYGIIGIKTWIYKGDVYDLNDKESDDVADKPKSSAKKPKQKTN